MSTWFLVLQAFLLGGMVVMGFLVFRLHSLMASAVALSASSLMLALEFYVLRAPDVAIAEASIGAGLTTAILMMAIRSVQRREARNRAEQEAREGAGAVATAENGPKEAKP
ncbi:MAG: DUF4040 domain-containing protein [Kiritimatiellae bacterium]|nr:DUF4040 domain-containing protein [Kiritimatiellia bacterium]